MTNSDPVEKLLASDASQQTSSATSSGRAERGIGKASTARGRPAAAAR